jgi:hypothetical protein
MAVLSVRWFWRALTVGSPHNLRSPQQAPRPMEIEVEHLPDRLWSDLGFRRPRRDEDHHSPRSPPPL